MGNPLKTWIYGQAWKEVKRSLWELKNPQPYQDKIVDKVVDNVDNYNPKMDSPTETMSPAPIVINKSPLVQCSNKKFSMSSKPGI